MNDIFYNVLKTRKEYAQAKQEYIHQIQDFLENEPKHIKISFNGNKMYLTFDSIIPFDDRDLLKFCNEFGFLAPLIEFKELSERITWYKWKFIKIID